MSLIALLSAGPLPAATSKPTSDSTPATAPASTPSSQPSDDAFQQTLEKLAAKAARIKDLTADFTQTQESPLLIQPLVSSGTVNVRGSQTRWLTTRPQPLGMSTDDGELRLYYPQQHRVEVYKLDQRLAQLVASPLPRLDVLQRYFNIQRRPSTDKTDSADTHTDAPPTTLQLLLTPRDKSIASHVRQIQATLDTRTGLARELVITNADDEPTVIRFSHMQINPGLKDEDLVLQLPENTRIVHPLQTSKQGG